MTLQLISILTNFALSILGVYRGRAVANAGAADMSFNQKGAMLNNHHTSVYSSANKTDASFHSRLPGQGMSTDLRSSLNGDEQD